MNISKKDIVQDFFEKTAPIYSGYFDLKSKSGTTFNFNKRLEIINKMSSDFSGKLLDCAVGDGKISASLISNQNFSEATFVDLSANMLELCKNNCRIFESNVNLNYINSDIFEFLNNSDKRYNLIICSGLIAHISNPIELLQLLHNSLCLGGGIILQTTLLDSFMTKLVKLLTEEKYFRENGYRINYYTDKDIENICKSSSLEVEKRVKFSIGLQFLDRFISPKFNYFMESNLDIFSRYLGSESIYLLRRKS